MLRPEDRILVTDLYELTMAQAYWAHGVTGLATFSLFVRDLPPERGFLVAAGLEDVLRFLEDFRFPPEALEYLESTGIFARPFLDYLAELRFTGDVWAVPEGTLVFAQEPILEITAPIIQAQIAETYVINQVHLQTMIATKAARCVAAARGRGVVDFALRRTHGVDAGLKVARCSYLVGFQATSNVLAGKVYGIPITGTMAHSFIMAFAEEEEAFRAFAETFPERAIFLIDTYDTLEGARRAARVGLELRERGRRLLGVRLDSGDLLALSREVRRILDEAGLPEVRILASGGLDEYRIEELVQAGAPIDAFGVGTRMGVSEDWPWLDMAYKLVAYEGRPARKLSPGKASLPGPKQVFRFYDEEGKMKEDILALREERIEGGAPLLEKVMEGGRLLRPHPALAELRERFREAFGRLPEPYKALREAPRYPVRLSPSLEALANMRTAPREALGES
ncbi:MAG: nicotinate phosphoribosyltransferase [Thermoflexus hugenholtzii]|uniref:nicotinate phosphoribosyltransferase n=2 Tax=Thermoflexaceae TaxID=1495648 RepID=UPI001C779BC4|nr:MULTISPECIES: nicotinate phosphoribosyltransferase [Thermoflexus]QWK11494.1 MAG: nicotinate phosphoribosyltransferase [Thermoflexus hugenholtzii]